MDATTAAVEPANTPAVQHQVQATIERMTSALAVAYLDGVRSTYEPGAVVLFEPASSASGDEKLRLKFAELIAASARDPRIITGVSQPTFEYRC